MPAPLRIGNLALYKCAYSFIVTDLPSADFVHMTHHCTPARYLSIVLAVIVKSVSGRAYMQADALKR